MGTPAFALPTLKALHQAGHEIAAVYTQPPRPAGRGQKETPSPVQLYAEAHNLPVFHPVSLKTEEAQKQFNAHEADIAVVVAYGLLLPKPILEAYPLGCINVHPSDLPRWRGAAPLQRTIMAGDRETAICIMQMDEGLDTGDILLHEPHIVPEGMNAGQLHDMLSEKAGFLVLQTLAGFQAGSVSPQKQSDIGVLYAPKITKEEVQLDWSKPASVLRQQVLGLSPTPGASFSYNDEIIKVYDASETLASGEPGTALDDKLTIACGQNALRLTQLQRPGKKRMSADELLRSFALPKGTKL